MRRLTVPAATAKNTNNRGRTGRQNKLKPPRDRKAWGFAPAALRSLGQVRRDLMKFMHTIAAAAIAAAALAAGAFVAPASALDISGAGATFPYPIYAK